MVAISSGIFGVLHGIWGEIVAQGFGQFGLLQAYADVVAFAVYGWIDLVGDVVVAAVLSEPDVVSTGADPDLVVFPGEGRLPDAEMMAAGDHGDRLSHLVTEILLAVKQE